MNQDRLQTLRNDIVRAGVAHLLPQLEAIAAAGLPAGWQGQHLRQYRHNNDVSPNPEFVFAYDKSITDRVLSVAPADAVRDAERLDFMASEECRIESLSLPSGTRYRIDWPNLDEAQTDWFKAPREAIDAAMKSTPKEPAK